MGPTVPGSNPVNLVLQKNPKLIPSNQQWGSRVSDTLSLTIWITIAVADGSKCNFKQYTALSHFCYTFPECSLQC